MSESSYVCETYNCIISAPPHTSENDVCPLCKKSHFAGKKSKAAAKVKPEPAPEKAKPADVDTTPAKPAAKKSIFSRKGKA